MCAYCVPATELHGAVRGTPTRVLETPGRCVLSTGWPVKVQVKQQVKPLSSMFTYTYAAFTPWFDLDHQQTPLLPEITERGCFYIFLPTDPYDVGQIRSNHLIVSRKCWKSLQILAWPVPWPGLTSVNPFTKCNWGSAAAHLCQS